MKRWALESHKKYLQSFIPPTRMTLLGDEWCFVQKEIIGNLLAECDLTTLAPVTRKKLIQLLEGCILMYENEGLLADLGGWQEPSYDESWLSDDYSPWLRRIKSLLFLSKIIRSQFHHSLIADSTNIIIDTTGHPWLVDCHEDILANRLKGDEDPFEKFYLTKIKPLVCRILSFSLQKQHALGGIHCYREEIKNLRAIDGEQK